MNDQTVYEKNSDFIQREIAGECLLIPLRRQLNDSNNLYVMNETSSFIWKLLDGRTPLAQIRSGVLSEFEITEDKLGADLETLITDLLSIQAIREKG